MNFKNLLPLIIAALSTAACNKIEPDSNITGDPVFSVSMSIDGTSKLLTAGENDYYMFTGKNEDSGVYDFYGDLKQQDCSDDCSPGLKISFRGTSQFASDVTDGNSSLNYRAATPEVLAKARVSLEAVPVGEPPYTHVWEFENLPDQTGDKVVVEFDEFTNQTIKLTTTDGFGCQNISERNIDLSDISLGFVDCEDYMFFLEPSQDSSGMGTGQSIFVFLFSNSGVPDSAVWNDGMVGHLNFFDIDSIPTQICATVYDFGCEKEYCLQLASTVSAPGPAPSICATQFTANREIFFEQPDPTQPETVLIEYTDEAGIVFSSELLPQQQGAYFNILRSEMYELNETGEPTSLLEIEFNCQLASINGSVIELTKGSGVIAVGE